MPILQIGKWRDSLVECQSHTTNVWRLGLRRRQSGLGMEGHTGDSGLFLSATGSCRKVVSRVAALICLLKVIETLWS